MKRYILMLLAMAAFMTPASAKGDWKGKVVDENGEPVAFANVVLVSPADSSVISAATTEMDGTYNIATARKDGILMVAILGYETLYVEPQEGQVISLKTDSVMLGSATVSAVMPKTKVTGEGLQTSVRGSVLENVGTAKDVLERTPGIIKGQNGIEVIGKGAPLVYINGHKVTDSSELDRLLSSEVQSVEVINNPGAQYDATVNAVVRIRTIRRQGDGISLNAGMKDEQSLRYAPITSSKGDMMPYNDPSGNVDVNYRKGNVDVFGGVNAFRFSSRQTSTLYQKSLGDIEYVQDGELMNEYQQSTFSVNGGSNWQIAPNHSVGFKADYSRNWNVPSHQYLREDVLKNGTKLDEIMTVGDYHNGSITPHTLTSNAYYNGQVGKLGIDFNFDSFNSAETRDASTIETSEITGKSTIATSTESAYSLYAGKLVLSYPIWMGQLQTGTEETFSRTSDNYSITGSSLPSSSSKVSEDNIAAFANYAFYLQKIGQMSFGLRYEHVNYDYQDLFGTGSFKRNYDNFFPSMSYANAFGQVQVMGNFSMKTLRPNFSMLSDAIRYNSRYVLQSGNASLQPQTMTNASLTAVWKTFVFSGAYSRYDNMIATWSSRYNDEGVVLVKPRNLEEPYRCLTMFVNATPTVGIWSMNYTAGLIKQWLEITAEDPKNRSAQRTISFNDKPLFIAQLFNTLKFKHDWQVEFGAEYHSRGNTQNLYIYNQYLDLNFAVQKALLKDGSLVFRLEGKDMAGLANNNVRSDFGSHIIDQSNIMDTQRLVFSVRYRFNTAASKYKGTGAGQDTKGRMK